MDQRSPSQDSCSQVYLGLALEGRQDQYSHGSSSSPTSAFTITSPSPKQYLGEYPPLFP